MATAEIAERVGRSASQVRRVIAAANAERHVSAAEAASNGNGHHEYVPEDWTPEEIAAVKAEREAIAGQTTVDDFIPPEDEPWDGARAHSEGHRGDVPPEDDPAHPDTLAEFRGEAGEPVGPMPPAEPEDTDPEIETRVKGTRQLCIDFGEGADLPSGGTLVLKSAKLASGHYGMGDVVSGTFTARITDVGAKERLDSASEE